MSLNRPNKRGFLATRKKEEKKEGFLGFVSTILYALLIALVIRTVAYEPFNIPSESMLPTLLVGDYIFVSKFSYGYSRHSVIFSPDIGRGRIFESMPDRGDVAVFKLPRDNDTDYIKRIIGLPGDRIQVIDRLFDQAGRVGAIQLVRGGGSDNRGEIDRRTSKGGGNATEAGGEHIEHVGLPEAGTRIIVKT